MNTKDRTKEEISNDLTQVSQSVAELSESEAKLQGMKGHQSLSPRDPSV